MIKKIEIQICDLCKEEKEIQNIIVPVFRTFDANDGRTFYDRKIFSNEKLDLCNDCLEKITKVHSIGVCCDDYKVVK